MGLGNYQGKEEIDATGKYLVPGFIDAHVRLESSVVTPFQYANIVSNVSLPVILSLRLLTLGVFYVDQFKLI